MTDSESLLLEDRLWWVLGRKAIINQYIKCITKYLRMPTIVDIGCGSGGNLDILAKFGRVIGVEPSATLARRARGRGIAESIFQEDVLGLDECRNAQLFTMFDVLEHFVDDIKFLSQLNKSASKHTLLVSVPACRFLYSDHDRILHHYRRYNMKTLRSTLEEGGYHVLHMSYFMFFLFPLVLFSRMREKILARLGIKKTTVEIGDCPTILSVPFAATLRVEAFLARKIRFPIGLWLFAVAESSDVNNEDSTQIGGNVKCISNAS